MLHATRLCAGDCWRVTMGRVMSEDQLTLWTGAIRRRLNREKHERLAAEILESVELGAIHAISAEADTAGGMSKFADFESWLIEAVRRFDQYKLQALPPGTRILDIGCGAGQTLLVADELGFTATGLDVPDEKVFNEILGLLHLERIDHRIQPFASLPDLGGRFDVVTIFMTTFNKLPDGTPWHCDNWEYFLRDLHQYLNTGARVVVKFNVNKMISSHYPPDVWRLVCDLDLFSVARFRDSWILRAHPVLDQEAILVE